MDEETVVTRPHFEEALRAWTRFLGEQDLPTEILWVFDENVARLPDERALRFTPSFQIEFDPPQPGDARRAYEYFAGAEWPIAFRAIGTCASRSVCMLLCDDWFEGSDEGDGFHCLPEWQVLFDRGSGAPIAQVRDRRAWRHLKAQPQALSDLDFGMTLRALRELEQHGRILTPWRRGLNTATQLLKGRGDDAQAV